MIRNSCLAAVSLLFLSGAAEAITLYEEKGTTLDFSGSIRLMFENAKKTDAGQNSTHIKDESSRFGIGISHQIDSDLRGFGYLEFGNDTQSAENKFKLGNRQAYVGLARRSLGDIAIGRVLSPFDKVARSDYTYEYGGVLDFGDRYIGRSTGSSDDGKNDFIGRVSNSVRMMSAEFAGFSAGATYTLQNGDEINDINNAYTLAAFFRQANLRLAAGYGMAEGNGERAKKPQNYMDSKERVKAIKEEIWGIGAEYTLADLDLSLAVDYGQLRIKNDNQRSGDAYKKVNGTPKAELLGLGANWDWGRGNLYGGYYRKAGNHDANNWREQRYVIGADYELTKKVVTWVELAHEDQRADRYDKVTDRLLGLGLRIYF
ncbi:porin [Serratia rubidaea]|nr:porin [Serratia rubidaea]